jgi:hypothetical protein
MLHLSPTLEVALAVASVVMFVGTLVAVPILLVKVPDDYFARPHRSRSLPIKVLRTVLGLGLVALGVAMLVLPGQGLLTILLGLGVLDLKIKHRMIARILSMPKVHHAIDRLRRKAGKGPLEVPAAP